MRPLCSNVLRKPARPERPRRIVGEPDLVKPIIALDIEHRFVCEVCGKRAADVRPDFNWGSQLTAMAANG